MKRLSSMTAVLVLIPAAAHAQTAAPKPVSTPAQTHKVVRVIDGDTVVVQMPGGAERCRLIGVDAPELHPANKSMRIRGSSSIGPETGHKPSSLLDSRRAGSHHFRSNSSWMWRSVKLR
jgi:endonuclease YncB( thermonuclease family)